MKKLTKSALVGGIGAALLLGGAGSLAYWTDEASGGDGVIQSGSLDLGTVTAGGWQLSHAGAGGTPTAAVAFDPAAQSIVPGDVLTFTQNVPVTLDGENIAATFEADLVITPTLAGDTQDDALAAALDADDLAVTGVTGVTGDLAVDAQGSVTGEGTGTVAVTTTVAFPWGTEGEFNAAQLGSLDFAVDYTLTQVPGN